MGSVLESCGADSQLAGRKGQGMEKLSGLEMKSLVLRPSFVWLWADGVGILLPPIPLPGSPCSLQAAHADVVLPPVCDLEAHTAVLQ